MLEADGAEEALQVLSQAKGQVDLVVLDVIMRGRNGVELGERVRQLWPGQRIMCMSAHPAEAVRQGVPGSGVPYLQKPYTNDEALAKGPRGSGGSVEGDEINREGEKRTTGDTGC